MALRINIVITAAAALLLLFQPRRPDDLPPPLPSLFDLLGVILIATFVVVLPISATVGLRRASPGTKACKIHIGFLFIWITALIGSAFVHW